MSGLIEVERIHQASSDTLKYTPLTNNCSLKLLDPNTKEILHQIAYDEFLNLPPEITQKYGIQIWLNANTLAIRCDSETTLELSGVPPVSNIVVSSAGKVKLNSDVNPSESLLIKAPDVELAERLCCKEVLLDCAKITANRIEVPQDGTAKIMNAQECVFKSLSAKGEVSLHSSIVKCERVYFPEGGSLNLERSRLNATKHVHCEGVADLNLTHSIIKTQSVTCNGNANLNKASVIAGSIELAQNAEFKQSILKLSGDLLLKETANAQFDRSIVTSPSYYGNGKASFTTSQVNCGFFQQNSTAHYTDSTITAVDIIDVNDKQNALRTEFITQGQFYASDDVTLEKSAIDGVGYYQEKGHLLSKDSKVNLTGSMLLAENSSTNIDDSIIAADFLSMAGETEAHKSQFKTSVVQVLAALNIDDTNITATNNFFVGALAKLHMKDRSTLRTAKTEVQGEMRVADAGNVKTKTLEVHAHGVVSIADKSELTTKHAAVHGLVDIDNAQLVANQTTIVTGEVSLHKSAATLAELAVAHGGAVVAQEGSIAQVTDLKVDGGLVLDKSKFISLQKVELNSRSNTTIADASLEAKDAVEQHGALRAYNAEVKTAGEYKTTGDAQTTGSALKVTAENADLHGTTQLSESLETKGNKVNIAGPVTTKKATFNADHAANVQAAIRADETNFDTDFLTFSLTGSVTGKKLSTVTYATTMLPGSTVNVTKNNYQAFRYTNLGGMVAAYDSDISAVVQADAGINIPTIPSMPTTGAEAWDMACNSTKLWSVGTTLLSNISRSAASVANGILKAKGLYDSRDKLYQAWDSRHDITFGKKPLRHYIAPLLQAKGLVLSGVSLYNESTNLAQSQDPLYEIPTWSTAEKFGWQACAILAPNTTRESALSINAGMTATYTYNAQNAFAANAGFVTGNNVRVQSAFDLYNYGVYGGNTVNLEAQHLHNYGAAVAHEKLIFTAQEVHNAQGGLLRSEKTTQGDVAELFANAGTADFKGGKVKTGATENTGALNLATMHYQTDKMHNASGATTNISDHATLQATHYDNQGKTAVDATSKLKTQHTQANNGKLDIAAGGQHFSQGLAVGPVGAYANAGLLAGGIIFGVDGEPDQFVEVEQVQVAEGGELKASGLILAKGLVNEGHSEFAGAKVITQNFQQTATGTTDFNKANFIVQNSNFAGSTSIDASIVNVGNSQLQHGATIQVQASTLEGDQMAVDGKLQVTGESATTIKKVTVNQDGNYQLQESSYLGESLVNSGTMETDDAYVKADKFTNDGKLEVAKQLDVAVGTFESTQRSTMHGADRSVLAVEAQKTELGGSYDAASLSLKDASINGTQAAHLLEGSNEYAQVEVRENLSVETDAYVTLGNVNRAENVAIALAASSVTTTQNMSLRKVALTATDGDVNLRANVSGTEGARIEATGGINKQNVALVSEQGSVVAICDGVLHNEYGTMKAAQTVLAEAGTVENTKGNMSGKVTHVEATKEHVNNTGGLIEASEVAAVKAKTDVLNLAYQRQEQLRFAAPTVYDAGVIKGGTGNADSNGIGAQVHAGRNVVNSASTIGSSAKTVVRGDQSVNSETLSNTYTSHWDKYDTYQDTKIGLAQIYGVENLIESDGNVRMHGTKTESVSDTNILGKQGVTLESHTYNEREVHNKKSGRKNATDDTFAREVTNTTTTHGGDINLQSVDGSVHGLGAEFVFNNGGDLNAAAAKDIELSRRALSNTHTEKRKGFDFSVAGQSLTDHAPKTLPERASAADPTFASLVKAAHAKSPIDLLNAKNAVDDVSSLAKSIAANGVANTVLERTSATLTFSNSRSTTNYERAGAGGIYGADNVNFTAQCVKLGIDIKDADQMSVKAKALVLESLELHSSFKSKRSSLSASLSATGAFSQGAQHSKSHGSATTHSAAEISVGHLNIDIEDLVNNGCAINAQTASGRIDNLIMKSMLDQQKMSSTSIGASTNGNVTFTNLKQSSATVGAQATFNIAEGLDHQQLKIGRAENHGSSGLTGISNTTQQTLHEHNTTKGASLGLNCNQLQNPQKDGVNVSVGLIDQSMHAVVDQNGRRVIERHSVDVDLRLKLPKEAFAELQPIPDPEPQPNAKIVAVEDSKSQGSGKDDPQQQTATKGNSEVEATSAAEDKSPATETSSSDKTVPTAKAKSSPSVKTADSNKSDGSIAEEPANSDAKPGKAVKPIIGPKTHTTRTYTDAKGKTHYSSVKDGKFSKSATERAAESLSKRENEARLKLELDAREEKTLYDNEHEFVPGLATKVTAQATAYVQSNASLDPKRPTQIKDAKLFEAKAALNASAVTPLYNKQKSTAVGDFALSLYGPSALHESSAQVAVAANGQAEQYLGTKSMAAVSLGQFEYSSPKVCAKDLCAAAKVQIEVGYGAGVEVAKGNVSHKTATTTTNTSTNKLGLGAGPMVAVKTKIEVTHPKSRFDDGEPMLPAPYNNPALCYGDTPHELALAAMEQARQNALADIVEASKSEAASKFKP